MRSASLVVTGLIIAGICTAVGLLGSWAYSSLTN